MLSQGFYPQFVLLSPSATRGATHLPELTAVNSTHKLVVQECIWRRLRVANARFLIGVLTENPVNESYRELRPDRTTQRQTYGKSTAQLDRHSKLHRYLDAGPKRSDQTHFMSMDGQGPVI